VYIGRIWLLAKALKWCLAGSDEGIFMSELLGNIANMDILALMARSVS
jgi:hypothetical protein